MPNFDPSNGMIDYERASMNAIKICFQQQTYMGVFFTSAKTMYRAAIRFGLKTLYSENENFVQQIRSLPALAFLPATDVIPRSDEIKAQFPVEGESVLSFFEENYIGFKTRLSHPRKASEFDIIIMER